MYTVPDKAENVRDLVEVCENPVVYCNGKIGPLVYGDCKSQKLMENPVMWQNPIGCSCGRGATSSNTGHIWSQVIL